MEQTEGKVNYSTFLQPDWISIIQAEVTWVIVTCKSQFIHSSQQQITGNLREEQPTSKDQNGVMGDGQLNGKEIEGKNPSYKIQFGINKLKGVKGLRLHKVVIDRNRAILEEWT